jgi:hypothetical protein
VRKVVLSLSVGLLGAAAVTGIAWGVQLVGLPPPVHAQLAVARAARWFNDYRMSADVFDTGHGPVEGVCLHGATNDPHSEHSQLSFLALSPGHTIQVTQTRTKERVIDEHGRQDWPGLLAANAGCSYELLVEIGAATRAGVRIDASPAVVARRPVIALRLPPVRRERLTLYVDPTTYRPLAATAVIGGQRATARLHLMHLNRRLIGRFGLRARQP